MVKNDAQCIKQISSFSLNIPTEYFVVPINIIFYEFPTSHAFDYAFGLQF